MCKTQTWESRACGHKWTVLTKPCGEGKNISNCPTFEDLKVRPSVERRAATAASKSCPHCDKKDDYDGSQIRMIENPPTYGIKFGRGASRSDPGIEYLCRCNVM